MDKNNGLEVTKLRKNFQVLAGNDNLGTFSTMQRARTAAETAARLSEIHNLGLKVRIQEVQAVTDSDAA